jgi:hypothetical protein
MSPMSTAAMNAVVPQKAGVASGILSMSRMVGGTFGVAVLGAIFQSLARTRLDHLLAGVPLTHAQRDELVQNLGSGQVSHVTAHVRPDVAARISHAARETFVYGLSNSLQVSLGLALAGAVVALALVEGRGVRRRRVARERQATAKALGA